MATTAKDVDKIYNQAVALEEKMSDEEMTAADILTEPELLEKTPADFFDKPLDEINEWVGATDEVMVTENVRQYCKLLKEYDEYLELLITEQNTDEDDVDETLEKDFTGLDEKETNFAKDILNGEYDMIPAKYFEEKSLAELQEKFGNDMTDNLRKWLANNL